MDKIVSRRKFVRAFFTELASKITEPGPEGDVTEFRVKMDSLKEKCQVLADLDAAVFESLVSADVEPQENEVVEEMEVAQSYQDRFAVTLFGLAGNILSMIIWSRPHLKSTSSVVLVALAVSDTLVILNSIWLELAINYSLLKQYRGLPGFDKYVIYIHNYYMQWSFILSEVVYRMAATASLYLTVIITLERYICICHPFWFEEWCSYSRICKSVAATIVFSIAYRMSNFWEARVIRVRVIHEGKITPIYIRELTEYVYLRYIHVWTFIFVDYLLPLTFIVVLNTITTIKLRRMNKIRHEISDERKNENKLTMMMLYVVLEFLVCTSMSGFISLETIFPRAEPRSGSEKLLLRQLGDSFNTLNSSVNIATYFSSWQPFRRSFMKMCCGKTRSSRNHQQTIDLQDITT
ncbi:hypothetical protein GE061_007422 [Apolygus lucorum]|uniref:G-protein coupled receptors family 1 profile domain-containing protein n=1 Tax=Apolygus lucorum TaxID=248454 RepID=A0A8S9WU90_APOLU|nr:hypothetical protein GE061_007422 [Apolygus lucorum]